jgi:hypothetical protein
MKATELRLGNWMEFPDHLIKQQQIVYLDITASKNDYVKPIQLTPEWLERLGCKKQSNGTDFTISADGGSFYYLNYNRRTNEIHSISVVHPMLDDTQTAFTWHIKYVHQLQNLYHSLTGRELTTQQALQKP